jgi:large subunit ribosomal protein L19
MHKTIEDIQKKHLKLDLPTLRLGDTVSVGVLIQEGKKQRVQIYQGTLIAYHRSGRNSTITVRRIFQGIGVERIFLVHSKTIKYIKILRHAKVRRAKLYYLRKLKGKATRLREVFTKVSIIFELRILFSVKNYNPSNEKQSSKTVVVISNFLVIYELIKVNQN